MATMRYFSDYSLSNLSNPLIAKYITAIVANIVAMDIQAILNVS